MSGAGGHQDLVRLKWGGAAPVPAGLEVTRQEEGTVEGTREVEGIVEGMPMEGSEEARVVVEAAIKEDTVMVETTKEVVEECEGGVGRGRGKGRGRARPGSKRPQPAVAEDPLLVQAPTTATSTCMATLETAATSASTALGTVARPTSTARGLARPQLPRGGPRPRGAPRPLGFSPRTPGPRSSRPRTPGAQSFRPMAPGPQPLRLRPPAPFHSPRAPGLRGARPPGAMVGPRGPGPGTPGLRPRMRGPESQASQDNYPFYQTSSPSPYHTPAPYLPPVPPYSSTSFTNSREVITVEEEEEPLGWSGEAATQLPRLPASITMTRVNQVPHRLVSCSLETGEWMKGQH